LLTVNGRKLTVELVDESADGIGLLLSGRFEHCVGQKVTLRTSTDHAEVRIMNAEVLSPDSHGSGKPIARPITRLGVLRMRDLSLDAPSQGLRAHLRAWQSLARRYMPLDSPVLAAAVPVVMIVSLVIGLVWALEQDWTFVNIVAREMPETAPTGDHESMRAQRLLTPTNANAPLVEAQSKISLERHILNLLVDPVVARQLAITPHQQLQLERVRRTHGDSDRQAARAALAILTPDQRKQAFSLVAD
jgi:hypothetical protein